MKILCVSNTSFFLYNFARGLMKTLREEGFQVMAIAPPDDFRETLEAQGFPVIPLTQLNRKGSNPMEDVSLLLELRRIYKKERPDHAFSVHDSSLFDGWQRLQSFMGKATVLWQYPQNCPRRIYIMEKCCVVFFLMLKMSG